MKVQNVAGASSQRSIIQGFPVKQKEIALSYAAAFLTSGLIAVKTATPIGRYLGGLQLAFGLFFAKNGMLNNSHL